LNRLKVVWPPISPLINIGKAFTCIQKREEGLREGPAWKPFQTVNGGTRVLKPISKRHIFASVLFQGY